MRQFQAMAPPGETTRLFEIVDGRPVAPDRTPAGLREASGYAPAAVSDVPALLESLAGTTGSSRASKVQPPVDLCTERRVVCLGLNYRDHAAEVELDKTEPVVFVKFATVLTGPGATVTFPSAAEQLDYEAEVALLIGRGGKDISEGRGAEHIAGYLLANDLTSRGLQFGPGGQWTLGKNLDGTTPVGPVLGVLEDGEPLGGRRLRCTVNGEERQNADTGEMILPPAAIVEYLSRFFRLCPGDVILTGTPAGTAMGLPGGPYLKDGDAVRVECDDLGVLECTIRREE